MMLRTTISRIKKVCTVAFIPRVLRGDQRCAPVSYAVVRIAPKSTKPPDDSDQTTPDKSNDGASYVLPGEAIKIDDKDKKRPLTHHERCKRIINQAFGSAESTDDPDRVQSEQYCSHTVNIEETKREIIESEKATLKLKESPQSPIITDDRTQYGLFKMSRELIFEDLPDPPADEVAHLKEPELRASTVRVVREPDLSRNLENIEKTHQSVEKTHEAPTPPTQHLGPPTPEEEAQETDENKALSVEDAKALELLKEKYQINDNMQNTEDTSSTVNATTTVEIEQELLQKKENIEETPLVEAERAKNEGFNTPPHVLGDTKPTYHTTPSDNNMQQLDDYSDAIDQVATRCLQSPAGKVDEMLINEMENLDVRSNSNTPGKSPPMDVEDNLVQMNETKEQPSSDPLKDDRVGMRPRSVELTRDVGAILPNVGEETDKGLLEPHEDLLVKNELNIIPEVNAGDVSAKQNLNENLPQLNSSYASTVNTSAEEIKQGTDSIVPVEPQSIVTEGARFQKKMLATELPPTKLHTHKIEFRSKKSPNPEELPLKSEIVIDDVTPAASYNANYPKIVNKTSEHEGQPSPTGNDAKALCEEQNMDENLRQLHIEMTGAPDDAKISDNPLDDDEPQTSSERMKKEKEIIGNALTNQINNADELPINVEHVNIVGSHIAPHDPYFLENMRREIQRPLILTEEVTVDRNEEQRPKKVHQLQIESGEIEVEMPEKDSQSSHNLTITNVEQPKQESIENEQEEKPHDFERLKDQPELKKEMQDNAVTTQPCTVNRLFSKMPFTNFRLPNSKWSHIGRCGKVVPQPYEIGPENSAIEAQHTANATGKAILPNEVLRQSDMACMNSVKPELAHEKDANQMSKPFIDKQHDLVMQNEKLREAELDVKHKETSTVAQKAVIPEVKEFAFKKFSEQEQMKDVEYNEDMPAKPSLDEQCNLIMKSEELRSEELKSEEFKSEELKSEELKSEELKSEELKSEELKSEELKCEALNSEALKSEALKCETLNSEALKCEALKSEALKSEALKCEALKCEALNSEALKSEAFKGEALKRAALKCEALKSEALKSEALKCEALKCEALNSEALKSEALKSEALKSEALKSEALKSEALKCETLNSEPLKSEALKCETLNSEALKSEALKSKELKPEPALELKCKETSPEDSQQVEAYAFKKGIELVDDDYPDDVQAKRSLDYDLTMESETGKHNLNLMCKETCATTPQPVSLGDIALAYEQGTNIVEHESNIDCSQDEKTDLVPDLMSGETAHGTAVPPGQEHLTAVGYSYDRGANIGIIDDVEDYPAKRTLDDMVMEFERPPPHEIQTMIHVPPIVEQELPSLAEDVALSELLRRVRQRSRLMAFKEDYNTLAVAVSPAEAKCPGRAPRCPPMAPRSPPNNPIPPPSFGLPMLKRRPPACKPKRKPNTTKCSICDLSKLSGVEVGTLEDLDVFCERDDACGLFIRSSEADLADVVIDRLQNLGRTLAGVLRQVKSQVETMFARDYEPWVPIPSWPHTKKIDKPKVQPGYHGVPPCITGCPVFPKPNISRNPEPRCLPRPCEGFPKRSFSMLDCFAVSLGENQVYELGQF